MTPWRGFTRRRGGVVAATAATALVAAACLPLLHENGEEENDQGETVSMATYLAQHPGLAKRQQPIAFLREKLGDGEGNREAADGPAQELYTDRAFPRTSIASAQTQRAKADFASAQTRRGRKATSLAAPSLATAPSAISSQWKELGPVNPFVPAPVTYTGTPSVVSGRTTALAVGGTCVPRDCVVYAAAAGGGVWRTPDVLAGTPTWTQIGTSIPTNAIGSLLVDGSDRTGRTIYVGTGEPNGSSDSEAGLGLFRSTDGGSTFSLVKGSAPVAKDRSIASIAVDPRNRKHIVIGTAVARHGSSSVNGGRFTPPGAPPVGVYESTDGGLTFKPALVLPQDAVNPKSANGGDFFRGDATNVKLDPLDPGTVYAGMTAYGLYRRTGSGAWQRLFTDPYPDTTASRTEFDVTVKNGKTRVYLGNATSIAVTTGTGPTASTSYHAALYRSDDARSLKPQPDSGDPANAGWTLLSDPTPGTPGFSSFDFCSAQCSYDEVVVTPRGRPDEVFISGQMQYGEIGHQSNGRAVQRSADAGVHFTDMTNDARPQPHGLHPDHHALVVLPTKQETFLSASDGGVVRQSSPYVDKSADCLSAPRRITGADLADCQDWLSAIPTRNDEVNTGLRTLQFQSLSVAPTQPGLLLGGTQDNGTWSDDGRGANGPWFETVGGDGGQSGFDAATADIRYHSYYAPQHDVNFQGSNPTGWDWISDPLLASGEAASFYTPLKADPVTPGRVFDGLQHIWRTDDHGGDRAYLDQYCNEFTGTFPADKPCGDWKPLGGTKGDLTSTVWGNDRAGNYVVAVERAPRDHKTLWAATRVGRLFVSTDADAADPAAVTYTRIDSTATPTRFVSGIAIDPANPNVAYISYSGYSAYAPGGHVYRAVFDPKTGTASFSNISWDLGDQPITGVALDAATGDLYASTDFGVVSLPRGGTNWLATSGLPPVAVYGLTVDPKARILYAATHGRGAWQFRLKK